MREMQPMEATLQPSVRPSRNANWGCSRSKRLRPAFRWFVAGVLAGLCGNLQTSRGDNADDLATIRFAMESYASRVKTIEGTYKWAMSHEPGFKPGKGERIMNELVHEITFAVDLSHRRTFLNDAYSFFYWGKEKQRLPFRTRTISAFDDKVYYTLIHTHAASPVEHDVPIDTPLNLNFYSKDETANIEAPWHFAALNQSITGGDIVAFLSVGGAQVEGRDAIDGANCFRVVADFKAAKVTLWLDPAHDFLPRRQEQRKFEGGKPGKLLQRLETREFRQVDDVEHGGKIWFPWRGRALNFTEIINDIEVGEVRVNVPLDISRFQVDRARLPAGVRVTGDPARRVGGAYITGDKPEIWEDLNRRIDAEERKIMEKWERLDDSPPQGAGPPQRVLGVGFWSSSGFYMVLGIAGLVVCGIGVWRVKLAR